MNELVEKLTLDSQDLRRLILGEQPAVEQLDANNVLANLLKDQDGLEFDESDTTQSADQSDTATSSAQTNAAA